jgi:hypothetical protein
MSAPRWDRFPEYRRVDHLLPGDQTAEGDSYGWSTIVWSVPCHDHDGCRILCYVGDQVGTHRPVATTILSRLPLDRRFETTVEIRRPVPPGFPEMEYEHR